MTMTPRSPDSPAPSPRADVARAASGFVLVFVGALLFFGFVIASGLLGAVGQASLAFVFAIGLLAWLWLRLGRERRRRVVLDVRHFLRPSSRA
jgi:Flp pilus assembly protein TadB